MAVTMSALLLANSALGADYRYLLTQRFGPPLPGHPQLLTLAEWVNDGLMTGFFLLVGLELKRSVLHGALATRRRAMLPLAAALGGMIVPALLYILVNSRGPGVRGWGIPICTDIAFALAALQFCGRERPGLTAFLSALAIADDLGGIAVIAIFYAGHLHWLWLASGILALAIAALCRWQSGVHWWCYAMCGLGAWLALQGSGVHPILAGFGMALTIPDLPPWSGNSCLPSRFERHLQMWTDFAILPLFALVNAGLIFEHGALFQPIAVGVMLGLIAGKPVGIALVSWAVVRIGWCDLPVGVRFSDLLGVAFLAGIGFTMSLFIALLAFGDGPLETPARIGILAGSLVSGVVGIVILQLAPDPKAISRIPSASGEIE